MQKLIAAINAIDWALLQQQKQYLLTLRVDTRIDGIVHLLDALQDAAVDDGIATESEVFP